ncbi:uncharacterized protein N7506_005650 [Penicillium brevicompactum]|uniref:uncharacterized protein n=1 Tax=Penicillium brevicompactum TaxID=5074 RepID=UPI0025425BEF|nr:uncharacterized protein N7506_005650 [Penicillium brevicompactum]KAJ5335714.1 hypothetical protein N7506_005650 [Penicillium brevicompactum]
MSESRSEQACVVVRITIDFVPVERRRQNKTTEIDITIVFSANGHDCVFGSDGGSLSGGHVIMDWKVGAMGLEPYASRLATACEELRQSAPQVGEINPATIYRRLLSHIVDTVQGQLYRRHGRRFDGIECYLTYPVSCSESLKLLLYQAATAVDLNVLGGVSEPLAAAYYIKSKTSLKFQSGAKLIIDLGSATVDVSVVYEDSMGCIMQACASDGLRPRPISNPDALPTRRRWALYTSLSFNRCKRSFNGRSDHVICYGDGKAATISSDTMESFFEPLISRSVGLAEDMCNRTRLAGHPVNTIVVCGDVTGNYWFFQDFEQRQLSQTGIAICIQVPEPEIIAHGALAYSRSPIVEDHAIAQRLDLSYIGDYTKSGRRLKRRDWRTGIGWFLSEGQLATGLPRLLTFTKDIEPGTDDEADHLIETNVYTTYADSRELGQHIRENDLVDWDCGITYPVTDSILSTLSHLGTISGILPHEKLFPLRAEMYGSEFELQLTLEAYNNLLETQFAVKLPSGILCPLKDVRYFPLQLAPRSELLNRGALSDQIPANGTARDEPRSIHEQQNLTLSGSSLWVSPRSRGPSTLARNEHAARGISASGASHFNSTTSERTIIPFSEHNITQAKTATSFVRVRTATSFVRLETSASSTHVETATSFTNISVNNPPK